MHASDNPRYDCVRQGKMAAIINNPFQSSGPSIFLDGINPEEANWINLSNFQNTLLEDVS